MIIAVVGLSGAGKTSVARYISDKYGFQHISTSEIVGQEVLKRGLEDTKPNRARVAAELRKEFGDDIVTRLAYEARESEDVVFADLRSPGELDYLKSKGMVFVIRVDCDLEKRRLRLAEAGRPEEPGERDRMDMEKGIGCLLEMSDFSVDNSGDFSETARQIDRVMENIMSVREWDRIGFRCGIEIHQRLKGRKLFCRCPADVEGQEYMRLTRELRFSKSETGEVDRASLFELSRKREFTYYLYRGSSCLVESDESPPVQPDGGTLETASKILKALHCRRVDEVHFMRKIIVDGSNVSGFQRTGTIGYGGWIETSLGKVRIQTVCLEEESARPHDGGFRLNSLGIPLVEITTAPDIKSPEHAKEVAEKIGLILRSFEVQRGIGTIRQDINVSIRDGARVELKGFQYLKDIPEVIRSEIKRQDDLKRFIGEEFRTTDLSDLTGFFEGSGFRLYRGKKVYGFCIIGRQGLFRERAGPVHLGKEMAGYVKPFGLKGIIHSDEDLSKYGIEKEFSEMRKSLGWDGLIVTAAHHDEKALRDALEFLRNRVEMLGKEVPDETRAVRDGHTEFLRPTGTAARMYPETDILPVKLPDVEIPDKLLPDILDELRKETDRADELIRSDYLDTYLEFREKVDRSFLSSFLTSKIREFQRSGLRRPEREEIEKILMKLVAGELTKKGAVSALKAVLSGESMDGALKRFRRITGDDLRELLGKMDAKELMKKYGDRVDWEEAREVSREMLS